MSIYESWNHYLRELESPQQFIDWTLLWCVGSALQRRVYMGDYRQDPIFANGFTIFVAPPGIGKSMPARKAGSQILKHFRYIDPVKIEKTGLPPDKCWTDTISFSADNTTMESLIQQLNMTTRAVRMPLPNEHGNIVEQTTFHASLSMLLSEEMTSLFKPNNEGIAEALNQWYDAQDYHYKTKHQGEDKISNICVSFLGCTTPDKMKGLMARGILQNGFTARCIPIYADRKRHDCFQYVYTDDMQEALLVVRKHIKMLTEVKGEVKFTTEAQQYLKEYYEGSSEIVARKRAGENVKTPREAARINFDKRTDDYYGREKMHIYKTSIQLHFMETYGSMVIELDTVKKAMQWLKKVEIDMHKALASSGKNPLADYYKAVYDSIVDNNGLTLIQMKIAFSEDLEDIELLAVLKWLGEIGKIETKMLHGKMKYVAKTTK
jgi:hypothetical protein